MPLPFVALLALLLQVPTPLAFTLLLLAVALLLPYLEGHRGKEYLQRLSLRMPSKQTLTHGVLLFAGAFALLIVENVILSFLGLADTQNVAAVIRRQPALSLVLAVTLAPLAEELFFRGYAQKIIGVVLASLLFAALHWGYGSVAEVAAALSASLLWGWYVRKHGDLGPVVLAHAAFNAYSLLAIYSLT